MKCPTDDRCGASQNQIVRTYCNKKKGPVQSRKPHELPSVTLWSIKNKTFEDFWDGGAFQPQATVYHSQKGPKDISAVEEAVKAELLQTV